MFDEQVLWLSFVLSTRGPDGRESGGESVRSSSLRTLLRISRMVRIKNFLVQVEEQIRILWRKASQGKRLTLQFSASQEMCRSGRVQSTKTQMS